jgi:muramoyltetrapeptide carboxypeptidase LdcA involved in peptidoglycan recycling
LKIKFPKPLLPGHTIAVTAPSSGVSGAALARLDLGLAFLRAQGFEVVEGACLRAQHKDASAAAEIRARELEAFLHDPGVAAIFPPWGGELATELLDRIDFEALRDVEPKWLLGYSDLSTLQVPLTLLAGWATAHGPNLMDLAPTQTDELTTSTLAILACGRGETIEQRASSRYQIKWTPFEERIDAPFNLTEATRWQRLDGLTEDLCFTGRIIGGCLDTIAWLAGSRYGDIPSFVQRSGASGTILYLENVDMAPTGLVRCLLALKRHGWFEGLAGLLIGRSSGPEPVSAASLSYYDALHSVLQTLPYPVIVDVDIGHRPPQLTLINGARAVVTFRQNGGTVLQHLD